MAISHNPWNEKGIFSLVDEVIFKKTSAFFKGANYEIGRVFGFMGRQF